MEKDIRQSALYREVAAWFTSLFQPGSGRIVDGDHLSASADGRLLAFTGTLFDDLASAPATRICIADVAAGSLRIIARDTGNDRFPRWSPGDQRVAFLSDRSDAGDFQLFIADPDGSGECLAAPAADGCVEYLAWSPDGTRILLGVAGFGADMAGCQGGATVVKVASELPPWLPEVDSGDAENLWRSVWIYDLGAGTAQRVSPAGLNIWECTWLGNSALLAVASDHHSEGSWYRSRLLRLPLDGGEPQTLFTPTEQIGLPVANLAGTRAAIVEAVCSDRLIVAGDIRLIDPQSGAVRAIDTAGVDVTHVIWRNDRELVFTGHRGLATVVGQVDAENGTVSEVWSDSLRTMGAWYPSVAALPGGRVAALLESYEQPPQLTLMSRDGEWLVVSLQNPDGAGPPESLGRAEPFSWLARDGLEMQGWVIRPEQRRGTAPLVMDIHGGPVWACRNRWMARLRGAATLSRHGIVSFYPNPRGSSGRGQAFAALVRGDMGGEDTYDCLGGIDALVESGIADPGRLGVTGISYGGFMSAWLITQDPRFAAAVPISPTSNWYSQHRTSQIPFFDECFLNDSASAPGGKFFYRSPVMFADRVRCPTLTLTGARDQNTPPTQALEFHRSLLEHGATSVLVTYPTAGHGIRSFPEVIDHTARYVGWFLRHLGG